MTREEARHILDNLKPTNTKSSFDAYVVGKAITMAIEALEQEPCEDMTIAYLMGYYADKEPCDDVVSRQAVLDIINFEDKWLLDAKGHNANTEIAFSGMKSRVSNLPSVRPQESKWIPMTTRPMTEEEREHYREWSDVNEAMIFDCELPEDGQEVLVSYGDYVCVDTFCTDDGCYFEGVDIDDVDAWMPLPKPYEPQESEEE